MVLFLLFLRDQYHCLNFSPTWTYTSEVVASLYYYNLQYCQNCFILNRLYKKNLIIMVLNDTVREALTAGHLAHLVTLNKDGSP
jgi:hypothetical protein